MLKGKKISEAALKAITGGKYYGNGVTCTKKGCSVNWGQAFSCGVNRVGNMGHGNC